MEAIALTRVRPSHVPYCRPYDVAACSDSELYDALFHYCRLLEMLAWCGAAADEARVTLAELLSPLWEEAESRGIPLHHLPHVRRVVSVDDAGAA
jgi:hypothetical protein